MSNQKMNPEVKEKWLAALRSGEYKQGKGYLRTQEDEFCCLGVLCDLSEEYQGWKKSPGQERNVYEFGDLIAHPPQGVIDWAKVPHLVGKGDTVSDCTAKLMEMNDNGGKSFDQIANWIERNL